MDHGVRAIKHGGLCRIFHTMLPSCISAVISLPPAELDGLKSRLVGSCNFPTRQIFHKIPTDNWKFPTAAEVMDAENFNFATIFFKNGSFWPQICIIKRIFFTRFLDNFRTGQNLAWGAAAALSLRRPRDGATNCLRSQSGNLSGFGYYMASDLILAVNVFVTLLLSLAQFIIQS